MLIQMKQLHPKALLGAIISASLFCMAVPVVCQTNQNLEGQTDLGIWNKIFSQDFDAGPINEKIWRFAEGGGGWGNGELQKYTNSPDNARIEDGNLIIEARKTENGYTSARLHTRFSTNFTYGRVESRMKMPVTQSIWPALWMLGDTNGKNWPACGEIDIMESIGKQPRTVHATVHGSGYSGAKGITKAYDSPTSLNENWHVVAIEWEPDEIRWYHDGVNYQTLNKRDIPAGKKWAFDHDFYLIVNLAVGGGWPDYPDATSVFPQQFIIDYIRIYQKK